MNRRSVFITLAPWLGIAVAAVMLHQLLIPADPQRNDWRREAYVDRPEVYEAANTFLDLRDSVSALTLQIELAESRERARSSATSTMTGLHVTIDPGVTPLVGEHYRKAASAELELVANGESVHPVHVIVTIDSTVKANRRRRAVVLPADAAAPCTVIIRVAGQQPAHWNAGDKQVLGTCGFYARYGSAGAPMGAWLRESGMRTATHPPYASTPKAWQRERMSAREVRELPIIASCRLSADRCADLFNGEIAYAGFQYRLPGPSDVVMQYPMMSSSRSNLDTRMLATMAESMGDDRFRAMWQSPLPPMEAFEAQMGRPLTEWVHERVVEQVEPYRKGPSVPPVALAMSLMIATGAGLYGVFGVKRSMT